MSASADSASGAAPATVDELFAAAIRQLAPSPSARLDAEVLLAHALERPRSFVHSRGGEAVAPAVAARIAALIERRRRGEPVAYITGRREFWSLELEVDASVLIPRPETELLVEFALEILPVAAHARVLELGTGSGAVALAIARERPNARVTANDISTPALTLACRNAERLGIGNVTFVTGDWYETVGAMHCDLIVSNPPYVAGDDPALASGDASHEPRLALTPGPTGLEAIERIVAGARSHLRASGWLGVEHGAEQGAAVRALFSRHGLSTIRTRRDLAGHERVTTGRH